MVAEIEWVAAEEEALTTSSELGLPVLLDFFKPG